MAADSDDESALFPNLLTALSWAHKGAALPQRVPVPAYESPYDLSDPLGFAMDSDTETRSSFDGFDSVGPSSYGDDISDFGGLRLSRAWARLSSELRAPTDEDEVTESLKGYKPHVCPVQGCNRSYKYPPLIHETNPSWHKSPLISPLKPLSL